MTYNTGVRDGGICALLFRALCEKPSSLNFPYPLRKVLTTFDSSRGKVSWNHFYEKLTFHHSSFLPELTSVWLAVHITGCILMKIDLVTSDLSDVHFEHNANCSLLS